MLRSQEIAGKLDAWLRDWRETAPVLVTRRDDPIALGLGERRTSSHDDDEEEQEAPPVTTTPAAVSAG
jgi:hypothetical protein